MDRNRIAIFFIFFAYGMTCGCKAYKQRILNKYCKQDTIVRVDTTFIESVKYDTTFVDHYMTDTLVVTKDRLVLRYIKKDSLIYLSGECLPDTIIKTIRIPYKEAQPVLSRWDKIKITIGRYLQIIGLLAILVVLILLLIKK